MNNLQSKWGYGKNLVIFTEHIHWLKVSLITNKLEEKKNMFIDLICLMADRKVASGHMCFVTRLCSIK